MSIGPLPTLHLIPLTREDLARIVEDPEAFAASHATDVGDVGQSVAGIAEQSARFYDDPGTDAPWGGYLAVDTETGRVVGTCAFKGRPDARAVEIAHFTFPPYEGRGFATSMANRLDRVVPTRCGRKTPPSAPSASPRSSSPARRSTTRRTDRSGAGTSCVTVILH